MPIFLTDFTGFDGQQLSKDNPISVKWEAAAAPPQDTSSVEEETVFIGKMNGLDTRQGGVGVRINTY